MARRRSNTTSVKSVRAVERALDILHCFSADKPSMSVLEIQERVPLSRPTLYRLLHTLATRGLIRSAGEPQRFSLDYGVGRLDRLPVEWRRKASARSARSLSPSGRGLG